MEKVCKKKENEVQDYTARSKTILNRLNVIIKSNLSDFVWVHLSNSFF